MSGVRELKSKIKSVNNIAQITRAMKMIASSRIKKIDTLSKAARPYAYKIKEVTSELVNEVKDVVNPLMEYRDPDNILNIIISADKGLCGAYNHNLIKFAQKDIEKQKGRAEFIILGLKAKKYFSKSGVNIISDYVNWAPSYGFAKDIASFLSGKFIKKDIDEVNCYYVKSPTSLQQTPVVEKILPLKTMEEKAAPKDYIFEPDCAGVLDILLKKYLEVAVYSILLEARVSELSARLKAMTNATDNADKLKLELTLRYFRARQEAITNELIEVSSGAEALR